MKDKIDAIQAKLDEIYNDLAYNVTFIYERSDLHLLFDLSFHSVLSFKFQGKLIHKGWVETLVVSDTRCITGDTLLFTEQGMKEIKDCKKGLEVSTLAKNKKINKLYSFNDEKIIKIKTRRGFVLEGTSDHPVLTSVGFKELKDIKLNDFVGLRLNSKMFGKKRIPKEKARLYGYLIGDGCLTGNSSKNMARMCIHKKEKEVIKDFEKCLDRLEISFKRYLNHNCWDYWFSRKKLNLAYCNAGNKSVPLEILEGTKKTNIEFLKSLFEADGCHTKQEIIEFTSKSHKLINQMQLILLNLGILTTKTKKEVNDTAYYRLFISGNYTKIFLKEIGFVSKRKNKIRKKIVHRTTLDTLPNLSALINVVWQESKKKKLKIRFSNNTIRQWRYGNRNPQRKTLEKFLYLMKKVSYLKEYQELKDFLSLPVSWDPVTKITFKKLSKVYDLNIPIEHNFVSNGFISHNCGKSETADKMINHYKLGELCSGENTSFAGLIGGMQQVGSRWHLTWGKIPLNDRRLVVIDEVSGMPQDTIGLMSGVRSSGIAEIIKINIEKTQARTRLIWLSNPRQSISINQHNSGIDVVNRLIGKPEDVARFDAVLIMASDEVESKVINAYNRDTVAHTYTSKACHDLILWAWSRKPDDIKISPIATQEALNATNRLTQKYSSEFPIITTSEMKIKLARMATALAVRLFSTSDGNDVIVNPEHVLYIEMFLDRIYSKSCFGYDIWSIKTKQKTTLNDVDRIKEILEAESNALVDMLLETSQIRITDIEEVIDGDRKIAKRILSDLLLLKAVRKKHGFFYKSPAFIKLLKEYVT